MTVPGANSGTRRGAIDEAYYEFAADFAAKRGVKYSRSLDYVREGRKVVVLRTFSKVHGLAGARVGYGIASAQLIERISRQRAMYCVSSLAQAGALGGARRSRPHLAKLSKTTPRSRERLVAGNFRTLGIPMTETWANFLYCEVGRDAANFAEQLKVEGIMVRPLGPWGAPQAIRITIGTPEQNDALLKALRKMKNSYAAGKQTALVGRKQVPPLRSLCFAAVGMTGLMKCGSDCLFALCHWQLGGAVQSGVAA